MCIISERGASPSRCSARAFCRDGSGPFYAPARAPPRAVPDDLAEQGWGLGVPLPAARPPGAPCLGVRLGTVDNPPPDAWKHTGVQVISGDNLDTNTAQTPGMSRAAAVTFARTGAQKLWAGTVKIHPDAKTGAHHHGHLEVMSMKLRVDEQHSDRV